MQNENQIYAVNAQLLRGNESEAVVLLIYAPSAELAKNKITIYQQQNQLRLNYTFLPLPLELYFQRHAEEMFIEPIRTFSRDLSETHGVIIFMPNRYQQNDKMDSPCLIKTEVLLRDPNEVREPFLFQPLPDSVIPYLWSEEDSLNCYVIVNAGSSAWFLPYLERNDMRIACLYKGEQAKREQRVAPYLIQLPAFHSLAKELFSTPHLGQEKADGPQQWYKNFGFFFCSRRGFEELLWHFRKFIILPTYDKRQLYFRFYDPRVLEAYLDRLICYPKKLAAFFGGELIESIVLPKGDYFVHYVPSIDLSAQKQAKKQFDKFEMDIIITQRNESLFTELINAMLTAKPVLAEYYDREMIEKVVHHCYQVCHKHAIYQTSIIGIFSLLSLACGSVIDIADPQRRINQILQSQLSEQEKLYDIKKRFAFLAKQGIIQNKLGETNG